MPIVTTDIYKQMDEEYGKDMEKLFGPGLLTWPEDVDSSRMYMYTSNPKANSYFTGTRCSTCNDWI